MRRCVNEVVACHANQRKPHERDTAAGAVDDARPDQWGERVIRLIERPARLSLLEYLYFAGDDRFGALGVSLQMDAYVPAPSAALPVFDGLTDMHQAVQRVMAGKAPSEQQRRLLQPGVSMGGARPKSLMQIDGQSWVVKFSEGGDLTARAHSACTCSRPMWRCGRQAKPRAITN